MHRTLDFTAFLVLTQTACGIFENFIVNEMSTNKTFLNVTSCFGRKAYDLGVYPHMNLTIFQADQFCVDTGYTSGVFGYPIARRRWDHVMDVLVTNELLGNHSFLDMRFRPTSFSQSWFGDFNCAPVQIDSEIVMTGGPFDQCATVSFVDLQRDNFRTSKRIHSMNCNTQMAFVCETELGFLNISLYEGFEVQDIDFSVVTIVTIFNATNYTDCVVNCTTTSGCLSFTFNESDSQCLLYQLIRHSGPVSYTIVNSSNDVVHGFKTGCAATLMNTSLDFYPAGTYTELPLCGQSPIPPGYCPCTYGTPVITSQDELEKRVAEIVNNLTVSKDSTSKTRQRYVSAYERRPSAVAAGTIATIIIVGVLSLPIISDAVGMYMRVQLQKSKTKVRKIKEAKT